MSIAGAALVVFHGASGTGPAERMMASIRVAAVHNTVAVAMATGFEAAIIVRDDARAFAACEEATVDADLAGAAFSYPKRLASVVERYGLERPVVMGSGALPLLGAEEFRPVAEALAGEGIPRAVTNNFFSSDITGWTPGTLIADLEAFDRDNVLPRRLRDVAGAIVSSLPRSTATQFDIDTPADAAILSLDDRLPAVLSGALRAARLPVNGLRRVMPLFCDRTAEVTIAGRVGSTTWQHMERDTACRVRVFSEERGMAAAGPDHRPRSLLGFALQDAGPAQFFRRMAELGDALILDRRVIEAHLGIDTSREDRFQADLGNAKAVTDGRLSEFVAAAQEAPLPVVMGGHSIVSGGLMLLTDLAWLENDRRVAGDSTRPEGASPGAAP